MLINSYKRKYTQRSERKRKEEERRVKITANTNNLCEEGIVPSNYKAFQRDGGNTGGNTGGGMREETQRERERDRGTGE